MACFVQFGMFDLVDLALFVLIEFGVFKLEVVFIFEVVFIVEVLFKFEVAIFILRLSSCWRSS